MDIKMPKNKYSALFSVQVMIYYRLYAGYQYI